MVTFTQLCSHAGLQLEPQLEGLYNEWSTRKPAMPLVNKKFVMECANKFALPFNKTQRLISAVDEIEADEQLLKLALFLRDDMCAARHRCDLDDYRAMNPQIMSEKDLFSFVLLLSCVEPSLQRVKALGIPESLYAEIPFNPMKRQMQRFAETGDGTVKDFPWDMNFYTCSIFLLDRFYFIPFKHDDNITAFKNKTSGELVAAFAAPADYRADGQLCGTNGDNSKAGTSLFTETETEFSVTEINPCGVIGGVTRTLPKAEWQQVLKRGDILLGFHIPGGPGYDPEHLHSSICMARDFFDKYFPEIPFKGFGSESWLYDPHLRLMLKPDSNIIKMQNRMFIYPHESGDEMIYQELFGGKKEPDELKEESSLQRNAKAYIKNGGRFTAAGMFILKEDADKVLSETYTTPENIKSVMKLLEVKP